MPFTPFHFCPPLLLYGCYKIYQRFSSIEVKISYWVLILFASVSPDIQGVYSIFIDHRVPLHGFSHTIIGVVVYSLGTIVIQFVLWNLFPRSNHFLNDHYLSSLLIVISTSLLFHLVPDMFIYPEMMVFWPISKVSFGNLISYQQMALSLLFCGIIGMMLLGLSYSLDDFRKSNL